MTKHTEQEINEALKVVRDAFESDSLEVKVDGCWEPKHKTDHALIFDFEYRAKPQSREFWACIDDGPGVWGWSDEKERPDGEGWVRLREVIE